jgi:hypothetical protein
MLLAMVLKVPWNDVANEIKIYPKMVATLAPTINWKKNNHIHEEPNKSKIPFAMQLAFNTLV